jgi:thioredoxin reductase
MNTDTPRGTGAGAAAGARGDTHVDATDADVVVVGGGVAGVQAALVLARARRHVVVVDGGHPRNEHAHAVHNLAGHEGIAPAALLARARSDAARYGVEFVTGTVTGARSGDARRTAQDAGVPAWHITVARGDFNVTTRTTGTTSETDTTTGTGTGTTAETDTTTTTGTGTSTGTGTGTTAETAATATAAFTAGSLVLATGVTEDLPDVPGLAALWGRDVVSCPYCHGWEATGLPVAVVGSGPRAWRQLLLLSRFTDDLSLLADGPAGLEPAQLGLLDRLGVTVREDPVTRVAAEDGRLAGVEFADGRLVPYGALFAATARRQASSLPAVLGCAVSGAAVTTDADGRTSVPGVWAVGSCTEPSLTVAGAMGHATATAIALHNALLDSEMEVFGTAGGTVTTEQARN